jgi:hypothetical protein
MAIHNTPEERQIVKILEKLATPETERQAWIDQIHTEGMSEELAEQIQQNLTAPAEGETGVANRSLVAVEFAKMIRRWRMAKGAKKFR